MHREESTKYIGDLFHSSGKVKHNLLERTSKAHAILAEIRAILTDVPLGKYRTEIGLQLRQAMFINGLLFNSEVWQGAGSSDIKCLENVDHQLMRVICNGHAKTPLEFMYMETAAQPLKYYIASRRIMYLHNILNKSSNELIHRVYLAQRDNPTKGDFVELVKADLENIGIDYDEEYFKGQTKGQFKQHIKNNISKLVLRTLNLFNLITPRLETLITTSFIFNHT